MNAIADINTRYASTLEKLLAASSSIIRLERIIEAGQATIDVKQTQIEGLYAIAEGCVSMLEVARPLFPDDLLENLDALLIRSRKLMQLVKS
jgi:hypothetical protein